MADVPEIAKTRAQLVEEAITAALERRWDQALKLNNEISERFGVDEDTNNRLGKVLTEQGKLDRALTAYRATLEMNPLNTIATKNVNRLEALISEKASVPRGKGAVDVNLFVEEMGKTALAAVRLAPRFDPALVAPGDEVKLTPDKDSIKAETATGKAIGHVESKLARRVLKFIAGGNKYTAAVATVEGKAVRIMIRETFQAAAFKGVPSFPMQKASDFRAYTKDSLLREPEMEGLVGEDGNDPLDEDDDELDGMHAVVPGVDGDDDGDEDTRKEDSY